MIIRWGFRHYQSVLGGVWEALSLGREHCTYYLGLGVAIRISCDMEINFYNHIVLSLALINYSMFDVNPAGTIDCETETQTMT